MCSVCAPVASVLRRATTSWVAYSHGQTAVLVVHLAEAPTRRPPRHVVIRLGGVKLVCDATTPHSTGAPDSGPPAKYLALTVISPPPRRGTGPGSAAPRPRTRAAELLDLDRVHVAAGHRTLGLEVDLRPAEVRGLRQREPGVETSIALTGAEPFRIWCRSSPSPCTTPRHRAARPPTSAVLALVDRAQPALERDSSPGCTSCDHRRRTTRAPCPAAAEPGAVLVPRTRRSRRRTPRPSPCAPPGGSGPVRQGAERERRQAALVGRPVMPCGWRSSATPGRACRCRAPSRRRPAARCRRRRRSRAGSTAPTRSGAVAASPCPSTATARRSRRHARGRSRRARPENRRGSRPAGFAAAGRDQLVVDLAARDPGRLVVIPLVAYRDTERVVSRRASPRRAGTLSWS